mgnify:CR=1 FL=1
MTRPGWDDVVAVFLVRLRGSDWRPSPAAAQDAISDEALVMTTTLSLELRTFLLRCRSRDGLVARLGASGGSALSPGVRALFVGPSGTRQDDGRRLVGEKARVAGVSR